MSDFAHKQVDKMIDEIEKELTHNYTEALKKLNNKLKDIYVKIDMSKSEAERARYIMQSKRIHKLIDKMAKELQYTNQNSIDIIKDNTYRNYALNHQYATYEVEHLTGYDTGYNLFNRDAVKKILKKELTPFTEIAYEGLLDRGVIMRDLTRQITQGILLGESIQKIAKRVGEVAEKNLNDSIRIARTEMTRVQSAGRQDAFERAETMGLKLKKKWISTLDSRTRASHAEMMGEEVEISKPFSNGLMYPGAVGGHPREVINCRCTHVVEFVGIEKSAKEKELDERLKELSFKQWGELRD